MSARFFFLPNCDSERTRKICNPIKVNKWSIYLKGFGENIKFSIFHLFSKKDQRNIK